MLVLLMVTRILDIPQRNSVKDTHEAVQKIRKMGIDNFRFWETTSKLMTSSTCTPTLSSKLNQFASNKVRRSFQEGSVELAEHSYFKEDNMVNVYCSQDYLPLYPEYGCWFIFKFMFWSCYLPATRWCSVSHVMR